MNADRTAESAELIEMRIEVDKTFDSLNCASGRGRRKSYRRYSKAIRSQQEEDEERQKILMEALHGSNNKKAVEKDRDKEMRKAEAIKIALAKAKQLAARAFKEDIIDQLSTAVEEQPLFHAGTMLDASARVYSFRVDVTHSEACDVRMKLGDPAALNKADGEKQIGKRHFEDANASSSDSSDFEKEVNCSTGSADGMRNPAADKDSHKKSRIHQEGSDTEEDADDEITLRDTNGSCDLGDFPTRLEVSDSDSEDGVTNTVQLIEKFKRKADNAHAKCLQRRSKVAMVLTDTTDLDDREEISQFSGHLYSKATHNFDEGSTSGLLMQNVVIGKHGRRFLLHNDLKCPPDPPHEMVDPDHLIPFYGLIEDIEKAEPPDSATIFGEDDPSTSLLTDPTGQGDETLTFLGPDGNATFAVEATLDIPTRCALLRSMKELLKRSLPCSPEGALFLSRIQLQKKFGISSRKLIKIIENSVKLVDPSLYTSLVHTMLTPPRPHILSAAVRSAVSESYIANSVLADELELFEQSFDWVLYRLRWDKMKDAGRAAALKALPGEDPEYNYFFAKSNECPFLVEEGDKAEEDAYLWRSEVRVHDDEGKVIEQDYKVLAQVLSNFKIVKGASLFTRKGDALNRTLAAMPIFISARGRVEQAVAMNTDLEVTSLASASRTIGADEMAAAETMPVIGVQEEFSGDMSSAINDDVLAVENYVPLCDKSAVGGDVQTLSVIAGEDAAGMGPDLIAADSGSPSTAVGDLHFLDENAILKTVSSLIADETHWKKAKPNAETASVTQKQFETETKKKERTKVKKEQDAKQMFEWSDEDDMPLSALRDRITNAKRPLALCRSEEDLLIAPRTRRIPMHLYMPHYFCKLSHVFVGEWGKLRINRASSAPLERPHHEERWIDNVVRDMQTNDEPSAGKSFMEFLAMFNGYFNNADDRSVRAGSEPYLNASSGDLFDEHTGQTDDDDVDIENTSACAPSGSKQNRSFFSEVDSDVEDAEMFGVKYSIRQRRINAPAVKRAIGTVLSNKELDADMLNAQLQLARQLNLEEANKLGDRDVSIISENGDLDVSLIESRKNGLLDMSTEEEQLQMREEKEMGEDPTCELRKSGVKLSNVTLNGRHTFSSLLVRVPDYLTGRTANDLNPINAFSVLLHMCNENNLELVQHHDHNNMILPSAMDDFTIIASRRNKRKHH